MYSSAMEGIRWKNENFWKIWMEMYVCKQNEALISFGVHDSSTVTYSNATGMGAVWCVWRRGDTYIVMFFAEPEEVRENKSQFILSVGIHSHSYW